jgi:hypothetical protein
LKTIGAIFLLKMNVARLKQKIGLFPDFIASPTALAPIAVEILLCRGSAQKIGTDSGKKLPKTTLNLKKDINPKK